MLVLESIFSLLIALLAQAVDPTWIALNMTVAKRMGDQEFYYAEVPVTVGSPPQTANMAVDLGGSVLAAWSNNCMFCPGNSLFDSSSSTTLSYMSRPWENSDAQFGGRWTNDIWNFGGVFDITYNDFVLIDHMSTEFPLRVHNGHLGLYVPQNESGRSVNIFKHLWGSKQILNPVIGMRFDPVNPKLSIGALDPNDYEGEINWVQLEESEDSWDMYNVVKIDGFKGMNGTFLPYGNSVRAGISSYLRDIQVPNAAPYIFDSNMTGIVNGSINIYPDSSGFAYGCPLSSWNDTSSAPYVSFTVTINGIDYMMDSKDNMIRPPSPMSAEGYCNVAIINSTGTAGTIPEAALGMPFLRSVYLAYRFPTDDCPGYYGFAFPSGLNRTEAQKTQKPRTTPVDASRCLNLQIPTSTPTPAPVATNADVLRKQKMSQSTYKVYMNERDGLVPLVGWDELPKEVWGFTELGSN